MSEIERRKRYEPYFAIVIEGVEIPEELVEQLCRADGFSSAVVIYDSKLGAALEAADLAFRGTRGSYRGTDKLRAIARQHGLADD